MSDVQPKKGNGAGVAGLILGILAVIVAIIPVINWIAWLFWIPGLIFPNFDVLWRNIELFTDNNLEYVEIFFDEFANHQSNCLHRCVFFIQEDCRI